MIQPQVSRVPEEDGRGVSRDRTVQENVPALGGDDLGVMEEHRCIRNTQPQEH